MLLFPFDSTYIQPIDIYEIKLDLTVLFLFVHALFLFVLSPLFFGMFGVLGITFGLAILVGVLLRKLRSVQ